ncbi:ABC transporter permease [Nakamurella alba]|uniref:ABC transporter permease n=1 Tax=Nakamurella alba TaxID=2665158 RepID=UPI0018AB8278|nr:ABC transporter permease [Nakamurella alba]
MRNFASRELKGRFKGSALGWAWSLINPLATLAVYATIFGFFLKFEPPTGGNGTLHNFAIYLFTALVLWNYFFAVVTGSMGALIGAGPLMKKIYFPPWTPIVGSALATLTQLGIELGLLVVVYIIIGNISWTVLLVPVLVALLTLFSLGLGFALAILNAKFRDVNYIVTVLMNLLFYSAPIIYPISLVREQYALHPWARIYEWNPLVQFVEGMKDLLYSLKAPSLSSMLYMVVVSVGVFVLGAWFFDRTSRDVSDEL